MLLKILGKMFFLASQQIFLAYMLSEIIGISGSSLKSKTVCFSITCLFTMLEADQY